MQPRLLLRVLAVFCLVCSALPHLRAADTTPPVILSVSPAPGSTVSNLTQITVTFSEAIVGAQLSDLLLGEVPALARSGTGAVHVFTFSQPGPGVVPVDFDVDTGITDAAGNSFDATATNASWQYTVADTVRPAVARSSPVAGATVASLTQIEVVFTEPVSGVDAGDLLINGTGAASVTAAGADRYLFGFTQPANGTVTISWAGAHNINDLATVPNGFLAAGWSYVLNPALAPDVVINEFLADNLNSLSDADGQKGDWIELRNRGGTAVSLLGWALTDDAADLGKWTFPNLTLGAGQHLVVFASGKDRKTTVAGTTNHTSFTLPPGGGYLALSRPEFPRAAVSAFPAYPEQRSDVSYGLASGTNESHFSVLTPGIANNLGSAVSGFAQPPHASVNSGFFDRAFNLALASATAGAEIRYTLDGSAPGASNALYTGALSIAGTPQRGAVTVRAAAFKAGLLPSTPITRTYIFPDSVIQQPANPPGFPATWVSPCTFPPPPQALNCVTATADYEMDPQVLTNTVNNYGPRARAGLLALPTLSIVTHTNLLFSPALGVYVRREPFNQQQVNVEMIYPDGSEGFNLTAGLEVVGGTSPNDQGSFWKSRKLNMRLMFRGEFGPTKLEHRVFPDSTVDEYDTLIVDAGSNYYWTYNGTSATDDQRQRATYTRDQYVADLQNAMGRKGPHGRYVHVYLNGLYWGMHCLHERPDHSFSASHFGGDKGGYDVIKHRVATVVNGYNTNYTAMHALSRTGLTNNTVYENLQAMLDLPWFIDYMILNFYAGNDDWAHQNWYCSRVPGFGWRYLSWDAEHTFKSLTYNSVTDLDAGDTPTAMFQLLRTNAEFRLKFADHVHRHYFNGGVLHTPTTAPLTNAALLAANRPASLFMKRINEVDAAMVAESARWGDTGETGTARANNPLTRDREWFTEVEGLMGRTNLAGYSANYFPQRAATVLGQMRALGVYTSNQPPVFSQHGGTVPAGYELYMTNVAPGSTIYFTTNGADPRVYGSGAVSGDAAIYSGTPVTLTRSTVVKARSLLGTNWSALNEAAFAVGILGVPVRVTEIMYHPPGGDAHEYIELLNLGPVALNLGGCSFDGIDFAFPPSFSLAAGGRIVLASDELPSSFAARYPGVSVAGWFGGSLNNGGERLALKDAAGNTIVSVDYDDAHPWPVAADGGGASLEIIDPNGDPDDPANWRASSVLHGTPGQSPSAAPSPAIVINEILALNLTTTNNGGTYPDYVELYNPSGPPVNLTGWSLSDNGNPRRFVFTNGPTINPGGYLLLWCDTNFAAPGLHTGFALDRDGGGVFLYDAATNRVDARSFGRQTADRSLSRVNIPHTSWYSATPTPGYGDPSLPGLLPPGLVINEWLANAPPGQSDWIELHSRFGVYPLNGVYLSVNGALFRCSALSFIEAGGYFRLYADEQPGPGHLDFKLPAAGATIVLYDLWGTELDRVTYGPQTEGVSQGRLPNGTGSVTSFPVSSSPGASNYLIAYTGPVLNEVMARNNSTLAGPGGGYADWIELFNPNPFATNISGMSLGQSAGDAGRWTIPAGTTVGANGHLVIYCDGDQPATLAGVTNQNTGFSLSADGAGLYLFNSASQLVNRVEFGFQIADRSLGLSGGQWKLLSTPTPGAANSAAAPLGAVTGLRLNEWLSNPARGGDWFELFNTNAAPVDLGGLFLSDDPSLAGVTNFQIAPLSFIAGGGWVRFIADGSPGEGPAHVNFSLDALGDALRLYGTNLALLDAADFGPLSAGESQGRLPDGRATIVNFPISPSPGGANYLPLTDVVISEVLTRAQTPLEDTVELANLSGSEASIGGWFLSDSDVNLKKYRIATGTLIASGGFAAFTQSQFGTNTDPGALAPFTFDGARGGAVYLSAADGAGNLTGWRSQFAFGAAADGVSFARVVTSVGADLAASTARTFPTTNAPPAIGPVVINEVMYQPLTFGVENPDEEFIELHNTTTNVVPLHDPANPANTWRLAGGVEFRFPTNVTMPSRGFLLVVNFDPVVELAALASFRATYGVPAGVPVFGPWSGRLDNAGEAVELLRPDVPLTAPPDTGFIPRILVDRLAFDPASPWPDAAGNAASLQRRRPSAYGNEPLHWKGELPTAGRPNVAGSTHTDADGDGLSDEWEGMNGLASNNAGDADGDADGDGRRNGDEFLDGTNPQSGASRLEAPAITVHPQDQLVPPGSNAVFSVSATGTAPLRYLWRRDEVFLEDATNATLVVANAVATSGARYSVVVFNGAGFAISGSATVFAAVPPAITSQPVSQSAPYLGSAAFSVAATGPPPLTFQWRRNSTNINNATNSSFVIPVVAVSDDADYTAVVSNPHGAVTSVVARLTVVTSVGITQQPQNVIVVPGSNGTFTVAATGQGTVRYQWQSNGVDIADATNSSLAITNCQLHMEADYRALVTDDLVTVPSASARLIVRVAPAFVIPPAGQTNAVGGTGFFTARLSGSVPMTLIWRRAAVAVLTNVSYSTNVSLTMPNLQFSDSNYYRLVVTNYGSPTSINALFTNAVWPVTAITAQPTNRTVVEGSSTIFNVAASSLQLRYQWFLNGGPVADATNASLTLSNILPAQAGGYSVIVTNIVGGATSQVATLTVLMRPVLSEPEYLPGGTMRFKLLGNSNQTYLIEASTNLVDWPALTNLLATNALTPFIDGTSPGMTNRFYRARLVP